MSDASGPVTAAGAGTPPHGDDLGAAAIEGDDRTPSPGREAGTRHGKGPEPEQK